MVPSITPYRLEDESFLRDSWHRSFEWSNEAKPIRKASKLAYDLWQRYRTDRILERSPVILVARMRFEPDLEKIVGWIVGEELPDAAVIHYVFVNNSHRREKIATRLLAAALPLLGSHPLYFTHGTWAQKIAQRKGFRFRHLENLLHAA